MFAELHSDINSLKSDLLQITGHPYYYTLTATQIDRHRDRKADRHRDSKRDINKTIHKDRKTNRDTETATPIDKETER
jgi:hypothetical protein